MKFLLTAICIFVSSNLFSQINPQFSFHEDIPGINPPFIANNFDVQYSFSGSYKKKPGHHTRQDWQHAIDSVWGPGLPVKEKLEIFDQFWNTINSSFACFHHLSINWDSLRNVYRPEIAAGVSKGRFSAILSKLALLLSESHTVVYDNVVAGIALRGYPLFTISGLGQTRFAAGTTPLPDSSLLVYSVINPHPLNLQRGDIILGYDRIPWKVLYKQLIEFELPVTFANWIGSSPSSFTHSLLRSAGRNYHLFDTIDIVKYNTGDTVHLSTLVMDGSGLILYNTEQMDIPGVPKPVNPEVVSYGIIQGTNIGYIYGWGWYYNAEAEFYNAVQNLMNTDGLIIDFRYNGGGNMHLSNQGLSLLFDSSHSTIDFGMRCSPKNFDMCPLNFPQYYVIPGSPPGYKKPIAVLTGQGAVSSGDQVALRFKYHRNARFFGKSTSTAFNSPETYSLAQNFTFRYATHDSYELSNPQEYLTHKEFEVDEEVWLTPDKVAQGRDDVVEAAVNWIQGAVGISSNNFEVPQNFILRQNYPNPFNPSTKIKFDLPKSDLVSLKIFDMLGREITTLVNKQLTEGSYEIDWNASDYPSGVYFYKLVTDNFAATKSMILKK